MRPVPILVVEYGPEAARACPDNWVQLLPKAIVSCFPSSPDNWAIVLFVNHLIEVE